MSTPEELSLEAQPDWIKGLVHFLMQESHCTALTALSVIEKAMKEQR